MSCNAVVDWPNWAGQTAIIVGTGPSAAKISLEWARNRHPCVVIKTSWQLVPWGADALYGADVGWWVANKGAPHFRGLKFCPCPSVCKVYRDIKRIELKRGAVVVTEPIGTVGCGLKAGGGHSGFQALNLAVQCGAKRLILVGFDMTLAGGAHWHTDYRGLAKPVADRVKSWREEMDAAAPQFERLGIEVWNASPQSALQAYRKVNGHELVGLLSVSAVALRDNHHGGLRSCLVG